MDTNFAIYISTTLSDGGQLLWKKKLLPEEQLFSLRLGSIFEGLCRKEVAEVISLSKNCRKKIATFLYSINLELSC